MLTAENIQLSHNSTINFKKSVEFTRDELGNTSLPFEMRLEIKFPNIAPEEIPEPICIKFNANKPHANST